MLDLISLFIDFSTPKYRVEDILDTWSPPRSNFKYYHSTYAFLNGVSGWNLDRCQALGADRQHAQTKIRGLVARDSMKMPHRDSYRALGLLTTSKFVTSIEQLKIGDPHYNMGVSLITRSLGWHRPHLS